MATLCAEIELSKEKVQFRLETRNFTRARIEVSELGHVFEFLFPEIWTLLFSTLLHKKWCHMILFRKDSR